MAPKPRPAVLASRTPSSIDAILDIVPAKLRPSWIGSKPAPKPVTPGVEAMKIPITIEFGSPGLKPPVYVATSLSEPQWEPMEMEHFTNHAGEYTFRKFFAVDEGEYQYKLRLGPGDWWICDDTQPQVDDGLGNKNNLIVVKFEAAKKLAPPTPAAHEVAAGDHAHAAPLLPHENHAPEIKEHPEQHPEPEPESHSPLMAHEIHVPEVKEHPDQHGPTEPPNHAPLMEHETLTPNEHPTTPPAEHIETLHSETHSPLFAHETASESSHHEEDVFRQISPLLTGVKTPESPIPDEADPNDPTLEKFPTVHKEIMEHLDRVHKTLPEDETSHHVSTRSSHSSDSSSPNPLPSVKESEEEEDEDQIAPESDVPKLRIFDADRPTNPITPPLTPKDIPVGDLPLGVAMSKENCRIIEKNTEALVSKISDKIPDHVKEPAVSVFLVVLGVAVAVAAAFISFWYLKSKSSLDHMVD